MNPLARLYRSCASARATRTLALALTTVLPACSADAEATDPSAGDVAAAATGADTTAAVDVFVRVVRKDGAPVPWAWAELVGNDGYRVFGGSGALGEVRGSAPRGSYRLRAFDGSHLLGETNVSLDEPLEAVVGAFSSHVLRVDVTRKQGVAVPWAWLQVTSAAGLRLYSNHRENGRFSLVLPDDTYELEAFDGDRTLGATRVRLGADEHVRIQEGAARTTDPPGADGPTSSGFVTANGTALMLDGKPFRFKGLNIYNANSRNNCWTSLAEGNALDEALDAIGPGQNAFRAWFFQSLATKDGRRDFSAFDKTLRVARSRGLKVIATLGNHWSHCDASGMDKNESWYRDGYRRPIGQELVSYRAWVEEVVTRYKDDPTILAWQVMNEAEASDNGRCSATAGTTLWAFAADVTALVKRTDDKHLVSLGTIGGGQCGTGGPGEWKELHALPAVDLCEYHDYGGDSAYPGDQYNGVRARIDECAALGKPIFAGEMGLRDGTPDRADKLAQKIRAQFSSGVVGALVWTWTHADAAPDGFNVGRNDPFLAKLSEL